MTLRVAVRYERHVRTLSLGFTFCCSLLPLNAMAQPAQTPIDSTVAAAIARARAMVDRGEGAATRALLDSLVKAQPSGSSESAEALYWRAVLADRASDAERDWKQLAVEAPLSARMPDALLWLGELELVRGHSADARRHLERIRRDYAAVPQRPKAMLWIARSYFEERDFSRACAAVAALRAEGVPNGELRLQAEEMQGRCNDAMAATARETSVRDTTRVREASVRDTMRARKTSVRDTVRVPARASVPTVPVPDPVSDPSVKRRQFSVQLAAFNTRAEATRMVNRLATRGVRARIDGDRKPFRVRSGRYRTEADARTALADLKKRGFTGFVAETTP